MGIKNRTGEPFRDKEAHTSNSDKSTTMFTHFGMAVKRRPPRQSFGGHTTWFAGPTELVS